MAWVILVVWFIVMFVGRHVTLNRWRTGGMSTGAVAIMAALTWGALPIVFVASGVQSEPMSGAILVLLTVLTGFSAAFGTLLVLRVVGREYPPK